VIAERSTLKSMAQVELSFTSPSPTRSELAQEGPRSSAPDRARARTASVTPLLLTVAEVAHRLGCGRTLVYDLIGSGQLETVKLGRLRRVPTEAVDVLVRQLRAVSRNGLDNHAEPT
jgi:excisionase family DNA binding protein